MLAGQCDVHGQHSSSNSITGPGHTASRQPKVGAAVPDAKQKYVQPVHLVGGMTAKRPGNLQVSRFLHGGSGYFLRGSWAHVGSRYAIVPMRRRTPKTLLRSLNQVRYLEIGHRTSLLPVSVWASTPTMQHVENNYQQGKKQLLSVWSWSGFTGIIVRPVSTFTTK